MLNDKMLKILVTSSVAIFTSSISLKAMEINQISSFQIGKVEGYAEMIRYHPESKSLLVTASETGTVERISISDPFNSLYAYEVVDLIDHPADARCIFNFNSLMHTLQTKTLDTQLVLWILTNWATHQRHFQHFLVRHASNP